ncbi:swr complex subunit [Friedmanniomyces endolithicus]|nr:swr complex subunit [Friedmanniomyces endolithicus]
MPRKGEKVAGAESDDVPVQEEYDENEDEDFNPDKALADEDASSSSDEEAESSIAKPAMRAKKRKADVTEDLDSGDEATIRERKRKRKRKNGAAGEAEESGGEGGFVRTRAQRVAEKAERREKKRTEVGDVTINVDDIWAELNRVPIGRPPPPPISVDDAHGQGESDQENLAADEEFITIRRRIEYAGETTEIEETVPRNSKEGQRYLKEHPPDGQPITPANVLRRPLRRPSAFEPNPTALIKGVPPEKLRLRAPSRVDVLLAAERVAEEQRKKAEKMTTVQKSALDWSGFVEKQGLREELEAYGKGTIKPDTSKESNHSVAEKDLPGLPPDSSTPQRRHTWIRRICVTLWIWETLSLLTSATCIGAIVVLLSHYDGKPLPDWKYGLTMNGVISILAVVTKASMMLPVAETLSQLKWCWFWKTHRPVCDFESFDGASRGPWGSLMMLLNVPLWSLGTLGAGLTVAAMFVEPALQQIPAYTSLPVRVGGSGLGRSINFTDTVTIGGEPGLSLAEGIKSAMFRGIFGTEDSVSTSSNCATGNCTWPTFSSLAVCSACEDLTSLLVQYPTPSTQPLTTFWIVSSNMNATSNIGAGSRSEFMYKTDVGDSAQTAFPALLNHTILDFQSMYWPPESTVMDPPSGVFECVLYFCVKTLSALEVNGRFSETVMSTWPPLNLSTLDEPNQDLYHDFLTNSNLSAAVSEHKRNFTLTPPDADVTYSVDRLTFDLLRTWVGGNLFNGQIFTSLQPASLWDDDDIAGRMYNELNDQLGPNKTIHGYNV